MVNLKRAISGLKLVKRILIIAGSGLEDMKQLHDNGMIQSDIACKYNTSQSNISRLIRKFDYDKPMEEWRAV